MSDKINVEAILKKYKWKELRFGKTAMKAAIKEIVEAVIDKCAENTQAYAVEDGGGYSGKVNKESILNVKNQIVYD